MTLEEDGRVIFDRLERAGVLYMVVGAVAQANYASPRFTTDLDIQARLEEPVPPQEATYLGAIIEQRTHGPVFDQQVLILHLPTRTTPVELFVTSHWFTKQALDRRTHVESDVFARRIPIPTVEDQILLKSVYRASHSRSPGKKAQDGVDLEALVSIHGASLDLHYLKENAQKLEVWPYVESLLDA